MINFGGTAEDIEKRVGFINEMHAAGHEIASHAVGHFDGRGWSAADWAQEFRNYRELVDHVAGNNGLPPGVNFRFRRPKSRASARRIFRPAPGFIRR